MKTERASKYDVVFKWLSTSAEPRVAVAFRHLESVLGFDLPAAARLWPQWWANESADSSRHIQCRGWLRAGFLTRNLNLLGQTVDFVRIHKSE